TESALLLLALTAPLVLHVLGKQRALVGPSPTALASLLGEQKSVLVGLIPVGLASLLGWSWLASEAGVASHVRREAAALPATRQPSWLVPLVILGALLLGVLAWLNWSATATAPVVPAARNIRVLQLPGGSNISVPEGSFNFSVANWLASTTDTSVPKRFVFEDLNFETGSTRLTPESGATVNNLVAVLKAYPAVTVALEGFTDNTGDPAANQKF